jgi:oxygen-independent coproporphyrinogen-3 oxidase
LPADDVATDMLGACQDRLVRAGFTRYEISAYASPGRECRHNLNYWSFGDYLGVGAGAHGKLTDAASETILRTTQQREPRRYQSGSPNAIARNAVASRDLPFEFMMNALRLTRGFPIELYGARTGLEWDELTAKFAALHSRGLVAVSAGKCKPTPFGVGFLNEMLLEFLPEKPVLTGKAVRSTGH